MAQAFFGGVHPNDMKAATNEKAIEQLAAPAEVVIPMSMHIGAPCKPIVSVGDKVIIMCYCQMSPEEVPANPPRVVFVDDDNKIARVTRYEKHGLLKDME